MNFTQNVDKDVVDAILESSLWKKAKIDVKPRSVNEDSSEEEIGTVAEYENGVANEYAEPGEIEDYDPASAEGFTLDDLQTVLDNLQDEDLMEHALNMLDVFDVAYEDILEASDPEEDEEDEEEEE